tara:strand:+ start:44663 stop:45079 length:417 start_codon:yes stop_codon:yes gene_type:complete
MKQISVDLRLRSAEVSEFVSQKQNRTDQREEVKLRSGCDNLSSPIDVLAILFDCGMKSFEASRKSSAQSEALRADLSKPVSNKGFMLVLILLGCRCMYYVLSFTRVPDASSACYESARERQGVKNALFPGHLCEFQYF